MAQAIFQVSRSIRVQRDIPLANLTIIAMLDGTRFCVLSKKPYQELVNDMVPVGQPHPMDSDGIRNLMEGAAARYPTEVVLFECVQAMQIIPMDVHSRF